MKRRYFRMFGVIMMMSCYLVLLATFIYGLWSPEREVLIQMNEYHEYKLELVLLLLAFPFTLLVTNDYIYTLARGRPPYE